MAIKRVQDLGGLSQLANTILQKRALDQQAIDKERAFGLQEAAGARAETSAELSRRIAEGQLTAQGLAATQATQKAEAGRSLADLVAGITPADQVGPPIPRDITLQRGAEITAAPGGGGVEQLSGFAKQLDIIRPGDAPKQAVRISPLQKGGGTFIAEDAEGNQIMVTSQFDPNVGGIETIQASLPEGFQLVSRIGETPEERKKREVETAGEKAEVTLAAELETKPKIKREETRAVLEEKIRLEPDLEKKKTLQRDAAQAAEKNIVQLAKTEQNIRNYDNAIKAVQQGATTGTIARLFPSFRESSILLDQMQAELGLDVVGSVTFGALSKGELDLAKEVALPTNLQGAELIKWIEGKRAVQVKMASILREASIFLSQPGNTRADWLEKNQAAIIPIGPGPGDDDQLTPTGRTATNPDTGDKVQELSDGSWVPVQ